MGAYDYGVLLLLLFLCEYRVMPEQSNMIWGGGKREGGQNNNDIRIPNTYTMDVQKYLPGLSETTLKSATKGLGFRLPAGLKSKDFEIRNKLQVSNLVQETHFS